MYQNDTCNEIQNNSGIKRYHETLTKTIQVSNDTCNKVQNSLSIKRYLKQTMYQTIHTKHNIKQTRYQAIP